MQHYLSILVNKIQRFTTRIDKKSFLTKKHWVVIDKELHNKKVYIFRPNGELLVSYNGNVHKARFEILDYGNILIEDTSNSFLYNQGFLDSEILILRKDGSNEFFTLVSHEIYTSEIQNVSQLEVYLTSKYLDENTEEESVKLDLEETLEIRTPLKLIDGDEIYLDGCAYNLMTGNDVFNKENQQLQDGKYILSDNQSIVVKEGKIRDVFYLKTYNIKDNTKIIIEHKDAIAPLVGDKVYNKDWSSAEDGEYKLSWLEKVYVEKGQIIKRKFLGI